MEPQRHRGPEIAQRKSAKQRMFSTPRPLRLHFPLKIEEKSATAADVFSANPGGANLASFGSENVSRETFSE